MSNTFVCLVFSFFKSRNTTYRKFTESFLPVGKKISKDIYIYIFLRREGEKKASVQYGGKTFFSNFSIDRLESISSFFTHNNIVKKVDKRIYNIVWDRDLNFGLSALADEIEGNIVQK